MKWKERLGVGGGTWSWFTAIQDPSSNFILPVAGSYFEVYRIFHSSLTTRDSHAKVQTTHVVHVTNKHIHHMELQQSLVLSHLPVAKAGFTSIPLTLHSLNCKDHYRKSRLQFTSYTLWTMQMCEWMHASISCLGKDDLVASALHKSTYACRNQWLLHATQVHRNN